MEPFSSFPFDLACNAPFHLGALNFNRGCGSVPSITLLYGFVGRTKFTCWTSVFLSVFRNESGRGATERVTVLELSGARLKGPRM